VHEIGAATPRLQMKKNRTQKANAEEASLVVPRKPPHPHKEQFYA